jgi:hypothetical protein
MEISELAKQLGARGGKKTAERGSDYYKTIGAKGAKSRWKNHKKKV